MRNVFSFLSFLLVSNFAFGQIEWVGNHEFSEAATDIVCTSQDQYILVHGGGGGITVLESDGSIVFEKYIFGYMGGTISEIIEMSDSSVVILSGGIDCDVFINMMLKYDKDWNLSWAQYNYRTGPASKFSDNSFVIAGDDFNDFNDIEKWDKDGNELWRIDLTGYTLQDLVVTPSDTLLVATQQGLLKLTEDGEVVDSLPNLIFDRLEILPNGNFLAQITDVLYLYSPDFAQLAFFQQQGDAIVDLAFDQDEIAVLTSASKVIRLDPDLTNIGTTQLTGHNQTIKTIAIADNGFMVGGGERYGSAEHGNESAFIKEFAIDGATAITAKDAALIQVSAGSQIEVENSFGIFYITIPDISVIVENMGPTTMNRLNVNLHLPDMQLPIWECFTFQSFSKSFENLNLQPGASMTLNWGEQVLLFGEDPTGQPLEICLWTSLPDHHLETNNDNDVSCTEVLVAAHEPFPIAFHHAFNAVADELYLEMQTDVDYAKAKAYIFNAVGQLVHSEGITGARQTLPLQELPDGAYFLQIVSGERVGWGKFAKY